MKRFSLLIVAAVVLAKSYANKCTSVTNDADADYHNYKHCFYPKYKPDSKHNQRMSRFTSCRNAVLKHDSTKTGYSIGLTHFCFWTDEEFNKSLNYLLDSDDHTMTMRSERSLEMRQAPVNFSWVDSGAVSSVKDQGQCGNCYTFAAVAALEGAYKIKYGYLYNLSAQQYTDCSQNYTAGTVTYKSCLGSVCTTWTAEKWYISANGNKGCNGGMYTSCWAYNNMTGQGTNSWTCYPFYSGTTTQAGSCAYSSACGVSVAVRNYTKLAQYDEIGLFNAVSSVGPVACAIDASQLSTYVGGVFNGTSTTINHAVVVVGYGTTASGVKYWVVKNSWGVTWGLNGYFLLARGSNALNIAKICAYPNVV